MNQQKYTQNLPTLKIIGPAGAVVNVPNIPSSVFLPDPSLMRTPKDIVKVTSQRQPTIKSVRF